MSISQDLKIFYPKYNHDYYLGSVSILEKDAGAKVKEVIFTSSDFHYVDTTMIEDSSSIFNLAAPFNPISHEIFKKDCDGIILFEENGEKYFFLIELKSSFATTHIYKAMHQIIASYIKSNMLMHLLATYEFTDFNFKAFIVCYPPKDNYKVDLYKQTLLPSNSKYKTEADFASELYVKKKVMLKASNCEKLKHFNLGNKCLFNALQFHFIEVPSGHDAITVDVNTYI